MSKLILIPEEELVGMMVSAVQDVFTTMLSMQVDLDRHESSMTSEESVPPAYNSNNPMIAANVGFSGKIYGMVYLCMEASLALKLTQQLLGMGELEPSDHEMVNDALGELANMTVGGFKNQLSHKGYSCQLTIPSILRGTNFSVESTSQSQRETFYFDTEGNAFVADLFIRLGD
ncbi:MAG: chemotaxis protein CheX [Opitutales bacterium]|nr:chemotaxis protein CheX [Opitutales bacterium]